MIKRAGATYKHIEQGVIVGRHKRKADAQLMSNAIRFGVSPADARKKAKK